MTTRKRRAPNEGTIRYDEARKRFEGRVVVGHKANGVPIRKKATGKTRSAVIVKMEAIKAATRAGLPAPDTRQTVSGFTEWWLQQVLPGEGLAPRSVAFYTYTLQRYVLPHVGSKRLAGQHALTPADVEAMTAALSRLGFSSRTQAAARASLSKVMRAAEVRGLAARNPVRLARSPGNSGRLRVVKALCRSEVENLLAAVSGTRWATPVLFALTTGLRPAEVLGLRWDDLKLDPDQGTASVSVCRSLTWLPGGVPELKAVKRPRSRRSVPVVSTALAALVDHRLVQDRQRSSAGADWAAEWDGLIFRSPAGKPIRIDTFAHEVAKLYPGAYPHRLRHTYATALLENGTPLAHVAELLGDTAAVVESTYSHILRVKFEAAATIEAFIQAQSDPQPEKAIQHTEF